jgi:8-oxo-dGTP diphosphatase
VSEAGDVVATVAAILVVERAGRVLLQLRDSLAPVLPDKWSLVGGHLEPGEQPEAGARREVLEESALTIDGPLEMVFEGPLPSGRGSGLTYWYVYAAPTSAGDAQIVVGEGADIVFVSPAAVAGLELAPSAARILPEFLGSPLHLALAARAAAAR